MRGLRTVGLVVCVGLAAGAGGFGLLRFAAAEDEWKPSSKPISDPAFLPAAAAEPFAQPPVLPAEPKTPDLKAGLAIPSIQITPPAPPAKSAEPVSLPRPAGTEKPLLPMTPAHNEKSAGPAPFAVPEPPAFTVNTPSLPPVEVVLPTGATPMPLSTRQAVLSAVFGVAVLTAPPAVAQDSGKKDEKDRTTPGLTTPGVTKTEFDDLKKSFDDLKKSLTALTETLEGRDKVTGNDGLLSAVRKLTADFAALQKRVDEMDKKQTESLRTAGSSPVGEKVVIGRATIRVVNEYPTQITMVVNGSPYRVEAMTTKDIGVSSGTFLYQLLTSGQGEVSSPVKDGEVLTLRVK